MRAGGRARSSFARRALAWSLALLALARAGRAQSYPNALIDRLLEQSDADTVIEMLNERLARDPQDPQAAFDLARAFAVKGNLDRAFEWLGRSVDFDCDGAVFAAYKKDSPGTDRLRADPRYAEFLRRWNARIQEEARARAEVVALPAAYIDGIGGHGDAVNCVVFSTDGRRLATGSTDRTIRVWDCETGACLAVLAGHTYEVEDVRFDRPGRRLVSASWDGCARIWDVERSAPALVLTNPEDGWTGVYAADFDPDGDRVVTASVHRDIHLWDSRDGRLIRQIGDPDLACYCARFSPDGTLLATAHSRGVRFWDAITGEPRGDFRTRPEVRASSFTRIAFSPDGDLLAASCESRNEISLFDVRSGELSSTLTGHEGGVLGVDFSPDGASVVGASADRTARIFDVDGSKPPIVFRGHAADVTCACFDSSGLRIATSSKDGTARLWDVKTRDCLRTFSGSIQNVRRVAFRADGKRLVSLDRSGAREWDAATLRPLECEGETPGLPTSPAAGETSPRIVRCFDPATYSGGASSRWKLAPSLTVPADTIDVAFSLDGSRAYVVRKSGEAMLVDTQSGQPLGRPFSHDVRVLESRSSACPQRATFSSDSRLLATGEHSDGTIEVVDARNGAIVRMLYGHEGIVATVAFSPGDDQIVSASNDDCARVWDAKSGECVLTLREHYGGTYAAAFSSRRKLLASGDGFGTIRVFDAKSGALLRTLQGHRGEVYCIAFNPDDRRLVSSSSDHTIRLWDVETGRLLATLLPYENGDWLEFGESLYYDGTPGGIGRADLVLNHVPHPLALFGESLRRPDQLAAEIAGAVVEKAIVSPPPTLLVASPAAAETISDDRTLRFEAIASGLGSGVERIEVMQDRAALAPAVLEPHVRREFGDQVVRLDLRLEIPAGASDTTVTLQAIGARGVRSRTQSFHVRYVPPKRELYLLALGVQEYDDHSLDLKCPRKDVDDLIAAFREQEGGFYGKVHVERLVDRDVTAPAARRLLDQFLVHAGPLDTIFVFVSGHAVNTELGKYFFLTGTATPKDPYSGIERSTLESLVTSDSLHARRRVLVLDTCYAGDLPPGAKGVAALEVPSLADPSAADNDGGLYILGASKRLQFAREENGNGLLTRALVDGLRGAADHRPYGNENGLIEIEELENYMKLEIVEKSGGMQKPTFARVQGGEDFPLARRVPDGR